MPSLPPTDEQVKIAKDFLWGYLEQPSKDLMIHLANYSRPGEDDNIQAIILRDKIIVGIETVKR